jgi:hypothetical protein
MRRAADVIGMFIGWLNSDRTYQMANPARFKMRKTRKMRSSSILFRCKYSGLDLNYTKTDITV